MFKKLLATAALVCSIPALANASWVLKTQITTAGGLVSVAVNGGTAEKTSVTNGPVFRTYSGGESVAITVTPNAGYTADAVSKTAGITGAGPYAISGRTKVGVYTEEDLLQGFTRAATTAINLTATAGAGGTVTPGSIPGIFAGTVLSAPVTFRCIPQKGYKVSNITNLGVAIAAPLTLSPAGAFPGALGQSVNVIIPAATPINSAITIACSFSTSEAVAVVGAPQTVVTGTQVTLTGSSTGAAGSFTKWSPVKYPAGLSAGQIATLSSVSTNLVFTPPLAGVYQFEYSVADTGSRAAAITTVYAVANAAGVADQCATCHTSNGVGASTTGWAASTHGLNTVVCASCHSGANTGAHPGTKQCSSCHGATGVAGKGPINVTPADTNSCTRCHAGSGNIHDVGVGAKTSCIACHDLAAPAHLGKVNDNNGVRAITTEFAKWSHHVTGVTLQDAHCAACHLEGKAQSGVIVVDTTYHMADAKVHLRNATDDSDMQWDPAAPNHTTMDNFCMSCHSAAGYSAGSRVAIQAIMAPAPGATRIASNPFADTISNRYDKMKRPAVVNVNDQFDTANNSHHAVRGARYSGNSRKATDATHKQIASPGTFATNSTATMFGVRSTIYDAGTFNAVYTPLGNAGGETTPRTGSRYLADDSTLHCGDCHTVGQWKVGSSKTAAGTATPDAIGAHGSDNEYLLRNSMGTDARHTQSAYTVASGVVTLTNPSGALLVCFNCHAFNKYGSAFNATGTTGPHAGEYANGGKCNGAGNTIPFNGYTTGTATDGTQFGSRFEGPITKYSSAAPYAGEQNADFGNALGMQCANCHNSGAGNAYGGIHGSKNNQTLAGYTNDPSVTGGSYIDGMGNTTKIMRFLPGLGNAMHVPGTLGGVTGGTTAKFKNYSAYGFTKFSSNRKTGTALAVAGLRPDHYYEMPIRNNTRANVQFTYSSNKAASNPTYTRLYGAKDGSYNYTTTGITNDTNWEQKGWKQSGANSTLDASMQMAQGAGCYTLGEASLAAAGSLDQGGQVIPARGAIMEDLEGPSQGVAGQPTPKMFDNWGGCDDHSAPAGGGNHGFIKRIVRPVTY